MKTFLTALLLSVFALVCTAPSLDAAPLRSPYYYLDGKSYELVRLNDQRPNGSLVVTFTTDGVNHFVQAGACPSNKLAYKIVHSRVYVQTLPFNPDDPVCLAAISLLEHLFREALPGAAVVSLESRLWVIGKHNAFVFRPLQYCNLNC